MTDQKPTLVVLDKDKLDREHFVTELAAYCNQYVMEIAKPIMEHAAELYEDKAIVKLVELWFAADSEYHHKRQSYLVQWFSDKENGYDFEPIDSYKWADERRQAYRTTLDALLVR